jgi:amino acid transporter
LDTNPLRRSIGLPLLTLYGLGTILGAGIYVLIGEVVTLAGPRAPAAFLLAAVLAGVTAFSFAELGSRVPKSAGEAAYSLAAFDLKWLAAIVGWAVVAVGTVSAATMVRGFVGYLDVFIQLPPPLVVIACIGVLTGIAIWGIGESLAAAATITVLEIAGLLFVCTIAADSLPQAGGNWRSLLPGLDTTALLGVVSGAFIAFYAFIGFEDIVNMAEETVDASATAPAAIIWTLGVTLVIYIALALVAVALPDRDALTNSDAPMATLFTAVTGMNGQPISAIAAVAMINGILVQIVMSARLLYGMAGEGLIPAWFGVVDERRRTPARATFVVAAVILILALSLPLVHLAELTSLVVLAVFALVNLSLFALGGGRDSAGLGGWRYWGLFGAALCIAILIFQLFGRLGLLS